MDGSPPGSTVHGILQARILGGLLFPSPGDLPNPRIKPGSPTLQADSQPSETQGKPSCGGKGVQFSGRFWTSGQSTIVIPIPLFKPVQMFKGLYFITSGWNVRWKTIWKGQCFQRPESCHGSELCSRGEGLPSALLALTASWNTREPAEGVEQIVPFFQKESCSEIWLRVRSEISTGLSTRHFVALWKEKESCRADCLVLCIPPYLPRTSLHWHSPASPPHFSLKSRTSKHCPSWMASMS